MNNEAQLPKYFTDSTIEVSFRIPISWYHEIQDYIERRAGEKNDVTVDRYIRAMTMHHFGFSDYYLRSLEKRENSYIESMEKKREYGKRYYELKKEEKLKELNNLLQKAEERKKRQREYVRKKSKEKKRLLRAELKKKEGKKKLKMKTKKKIFRKKKK